VRATLLIVAILATAFVAGAHGADQSDVKSILDKFQSVRPQAADLALYQLDWMPNLKEARERAAKEERPIFLVVVTNSFGDLFSGHC
jgi:hypothetical protein